MSEKQVDDYAYPELVGSPKARYIRLTRYQANKVWDLLVEVGGTQEDFRDMFIRYAMDDLMEFRFQGHLGLGGKIHGRGFEPRLFVDCYHDEHTPERDRIITEINKKLREMKLP